jgi:hypothetical protein
MASRRIVVAVISTFTQAGVEHARAFFKNMFSFVCLRVVPSAGRNILFLFVLFLFCYMPVSLPKVVSV